MALQHRDKGEGFPKVIPPPAQTPPPPPQAPIHPASWSQLAAFQRTGKPTFFL